MKKLAKSVFKPLDKYEEELIKSLENDEWVAVPNQKKEIEKIVAAAKYTLEKMNKDKRITIRVDNRDLKTIQDKALASGIPYQTIIGALIRQFANGKITVAL